MPFEVKVDQSYLKQLAKSAPMIYRDSESLVYRETEWLRNKTDEQIAAHGPVSTGRLRRSLNSKVRATKTAVTGTLRANVNYAESAHDGRSKGKAPPPGRMLAWVKRSVRQGRLTVTVKRGSSRENAYRSAAFAIGQAIGKRGTKGNPFFDIVYNEHGQESAKRLEAGITKIMRGYL